MLIVSFGRPPDVEEAIISKSFLRRKESEMSDKEKRIYSAEDFIVGLLAGGMSSKQVVEVMATAKKGHERRFRKGLDASWKFAELKKLRGRLIFGQWSWLDHGRMYRQSWDGAFVQDVIFFLDPERTLRAEGGLKTRRAFQMLVGIASKAVADCVGEADMKVVLTSKQIGIFFAEREV